MRSRRHQAAIAAPRVLRALAIGSVAIAALFPMTSSTLAAPAREPVEFMHLSTDAEVCADFGLEIAVVEHGYGFLEIFTDDAGVVTRVMLHLTVDYTMSANGVTVRQRDRKERIVTEDELREMGQGSIHAPGGQLNIGGGGQLIVLADGTEILHGNPPDLDIEAFCGAFLAS